LRKALDDRQKAMSGPDAEKNKAAVEALSKKLDTVEKGTRTAPGVGPVNRDLARLIFSIESADMRPADTVRAAVQQNCDALDKNLAQWQLLNQQDVVSFNQLLAASKAPALPIATAALGGCKQ
jgi:hypothetical protein